MKIVFDTDGTLTDFNKFVRDNAIDYFKNEYGMEVKNPNELEIEDIFDMDNFFVEKYNCDLNTAKEYTKKTLDKFWVNFVRFSKFSLLDKFRDGAAEFINLCIKNGNNIEIHISRGKTTEKGIVGTIARKFTFLQYKLNKVNVSMKNFHFYENDKDKINGIIKSKPDLVFEDKPEILLDLNEKGIKTICVNGQHNIDLEENEMLRKLDIYSEEEIESLINSLFGKKSYEILNRISKSDLLYKKVRLIRPIIFSKFKTIVLNEQNLILDDSGIVIVPNHMSTLDPLIITSLIDKNIHWAALKRFFDGKDSIFNNSKNPLLCKITANGFRRLEYFPIERIKDNPNANNFRSMKDMQNFLKQKQYVGIFPEGTTRKNEGEDFGVFSPAFITLAKKNNSWIQPITILWIKDLGLSEKVIINYGERFKVEDMTIEEAYNKYLRIQIANLEENKEYAKELKNNKILKKV